MRWIAPHRCASLGAVRDNSSPFQRIPSPCFSAVGQGGMEMTALPKELRKDTSQGTVLQRKYSGRDETRHSAELDSFE
jgi:hypothetical protein